MIPFIYSIASQSSPTGPPSYSNYFFLIIIAFVMFRFLMNGINGRKYSQSRILRRPIIYIVLTVILALSLYENYLYMLTVAIAFIPGIFFGDRFGKLSSVYKQGPIIMYKSNPVILIIWLVSLIARIFMELEYPTNIDGIFYTELLLSFTSGILLGEAFNIVNKVKNMNTGENQEPRTSIIESDMNGPT